MGEQEHEREEEVSPSCRVCALCYSNSQGQSAAKRQGKFKKVPNVSFCKMYLSLSLSVSLLFLFFLHMTWKLFYRIISVSSVVFKYTLFYS